MIRRLFEGISRNKWIKIRMNCSSKGIAKKFSLKDGTQSCIGINIGYAVIYGVINNDSRYYIGNAMHILLRVTLENLMYFYCAEHAAEIYSIYCRFNRL